MSSIPHVTQESFAQLIENSSLPVVVDAYATWCGPCQHMAPSFEELSQQYQGTYSFLKLDVDDARDLAIQFGISSVPTFLFFKHGKLVGTDLGYMSKAELESSIKKYLGA